MLHCFIHHHDHVGYFGSELHIFNIGQNQDPCMLTWDYIWCERWYDHFHPSRVMVVPLASWGQFGTSQCRWVVAVSHWTVRQVSVFCESVVVVES